MSHTTHTKVTDAVNPDGQFSSPGSSDNRSVAELVQDMSEQVSRLVRDEIRLAQVEITQKGKAAGKGAGMFGGAGVLALYGLAGLFTTIVLGLWALGLEAWLASLIVTVVLFAVAGVLALTGKKKVEEIGSPMPEQAVRSVKADINEVKERAHR